MSLSPQVLLDLSTELAQNVLQRGGGGGGKGEEHIHTTSHESHAGDVGGLCDARSCTECHCDSSLYLFQCGRDLLVEEGEHVLGRLFVSRPPHDSRTVPHGREHILEGVGRGGRGDVWRGGDGDGRGEEGSYIGDWDQYIQYIYIQCKLQYIVFHKKQEVM